MIAQTVERFGTLDILVNNAGTAAWTAGGDQSGRLAAGRRRQSHGVFLCAGGGQGDDRGRHGGRIINIASILEAVARAGAGRGLRRDQGRGGQPDAELAVHWAPHKILVNAIGPAYFPSR